MILGDFYIVVASLPDRDQVVAEIYYKNNQWVEINQELSDEMIIQFYSHPKQEYWEFPLEEALEALQQAKQKLLKMGSTEPLRRAWRDYEKAYAEVEEKCKHAKIIACKAKANYILWVRFDDGIEGDINLSDRAGQDAFKDWESQQFWESVHIDPESKTVCWGEEIELDPCELKKSILVSRLTLFPPDPTE